MNKEEKKGGGKGEGKEKKGTFLYLPSDRSGVLLCNVKCQKEKEGEESGGGGGEGGEKKEGEKKLVSHTGFGSSIFKCLTPSIAWVIGGGPGGEKKKRGEKIFIRIPDRESLIQVKFLSVQDFPFHIVFPIHINKRGRRGGGEKMSKAGLTGMPPCLPHQPN